MKKVFLFYSIILSIFLTVACSNLSDDYGYVSFKMPGVSGGRAAYTIEHLTYDITITNQKTNASTKYSADAGETFSAELKVGTYDISVEALAINKTGNKSVIYEGSVSDVVVQSGDTTKISIYLKAVKESEPTNIEIIVTKEEGNDITVRTYRDTIGATDYCVAEVTAYQDLEDVTWLINGRLYSEYKHPVVDTMNLFTVTRYYYNNTSQLYLAVSDIDRAPATTLTITCIVTYLDSEGNKKYSECSFNWVLTD